MVKIKMRKSILQIDGSVGEGGGQVLRTSLALSIVTGQGFSITNIRAGRKKPGLMRQHLACVHAARAICKAEVSGDELNSGEVQFIPAATGAMAGEYSFVVGSAGSTSLVLQTILPPLLMARGKSVVTIEGGTHNPTAPPFPFLDEVFVPLLRQMGAEVDIEMERPGFAPAGGGLIRATIWGKGTLGEFKLHERGDIELITAAAVCAGGLSGGIAQRELQSIAKRLTINPENMTHVMLDECICQGNFVAVRIKSQNVFEMFTAVGELGKKAETVANECVNEVREYLLSGVPVGSHLSDQILLPLALCRGGSFIAGTPTPHTRTNLQVIQTFLPGRICAEPLENGRWKISASAFQSVENSL